MLRKRHNLEETVAKSQQVDVLISQGKSVADACALARIWS